MGMETIGLGLLMAGASALSATAQSRAASKQARAQKEATEQAKQNAQRQAEVQREQMRMQNNKEADISQTLKDNTDPMLSGGATLLTGAQGVDSSELTLGKKSTLG